MELGRPRVWTLQKRRRARHKANVALRKRRETIEACRGRQDSEYAGLLPMLRYCDDEFELRERLEESLSMTKGRTAQYQPEDEAMAVLGRLLVGITRREHVDEMLPEMLVAEAMGIPKWPSGDTERRFLTRATETTLQGVDGILEDLAIQKGLAYGPYTVHVAADLSGLRSQARKREGVEPGYMGGVVKPGYQMMRVLVQGLPAWDDLRAGNDGCQDLSDHALRICGKVRQKLPQAQIHLGLDSGFGHGAHLGKVQAHHQRDRKFHYYIGGAAQYAPKRWWKEVVLAAGDTRRWDRVSKTTEILDLGWQRPWSGEAGIERVRVVATRRKEWGRARKNEKKDQDKNEYQYRVIYTDVSPEAVTARWVFSQYHERQRVETDIKDGKQSFRIKELPVRELLGNRLYVKMVAIAQGLMRLYLGEFEAYPGPDVWGPLSKTIRQRLFRASGKKSG